MGKQSHNLEKREETVFLDAAGIDRLADLLTQALGQTGAERREILRLRLATEDILAVWQDGVNRLAFYPPRPQRLGPLAQLLLVIAAAATCGLLCMAAPDGVGDGVSGVITPLFNALMGILQTLASPMIFLSVCCGIVNIGDVQTLGKIGNTVLLRFLGAIFLITGITAGCVVWLFRPESGAASVGGNAAAQIYHMLWEIIPTNVVEPFLEGNSLQIIFMSVCVGLALLVLGEKSSALRVLLEQANGAVQFMMEVVSRYIALFVFVSLLSLLLSNAVSNLGGVVKGLLLGIAACVAWPLLYALWACMRLKVSFPMVLRKLLPTYLIALSTASSSAALSTNLETCEKRLGISGHVAAAFTRLIQGIPTLVLLMVLYYIVFASTNFSGVAIAVLAFSINFGVYVSEMIRTGIDAVDAGQWEAAAALGFGRAKTFTKVIAPQAARHILPVYKGELISMVKMTSVVGYIAVEDLTKATDLICSRTFEPFFPLIVTAIIYFLLAWALTAALGVVERKIDPKRRRQAMKGLDLSVPAEQTPAEIAAAPAKQAGDGPVIIIAHLKKAYPNVTPLQDVNTDIFRGDVISVIGPSGTGKSTLLRCINRLEAPTAGEVLSVIRTLADQGLTMLIVTHEMKFARDVSTRVFYMDQGLIYEEGAPEQIFEHPATDRCRAFVHRLKTLRLEVSSRSFDFLGAAGQIDQFARRQLLDARQSLKFQQLFEELCVSVLLPALPAEGGWTVRFDAACREDGSQCEAAVSWQGAPFDPLTAGDALSVRLALAKTTGSSYAFEDGVNRVTVTF